MDACKASGWSWQGRAKFNAKMKINLRSHSGGIAMEIGIEPTARHAADPGIIPVVIEGACGGGHADAAQRSCQALHFAGDAIMTDTEAFCAALGRAGARA
jgi:Isochorismatase family